MEKINRDQNDFNQLVIRWLARRILMKIYNTIIIKDMLTHNIYRNRIITLMSFDYHRFIDNVSFK